MPKKCLTALFSPVESKMNETSSRQSHGIKAWPESERPRERLMRHGAGTLSDADLLAILLRSGIKGKDAIALGRELIMQFGSLRGLLSVDSKELKKVKGLGAAKVASLLAATEIARRQLREDVIGKDVIRDPESVVAYLMSSMRDKKKEVFKILFLNKANRILDEKDMFEGTVDEASIHPREVVKAALDLHATALVLVHNHPSGRREPSREDIEITKKLKAACEAVSVRILDHIIVGDNQIYSFREQQLLD